MPELFWERVRFRHGSCERRSVLRFLLGIKDHLAETHRRTPIRGNIPRWTRLVRQHSLGNSMTPNDRHRGRQWLPPGQTERIEDDWDWRAHKITDAEFEANFMNRHNAPIFKRRERIEKLKDIAFYLAIAGFIAGSILLGFWSVR